MNLFIEYTQSIYQVLFSNMLHNQCGTVDLGSKPSGESQLVSSETFNQVRPSKFKSWLKNLMRNS